jgi:hypothetical protein
MTPLRLAHSSTLPLRTKLSIVPFKMCPIGSLDSYRTLKAQRALARLIERHPVAGAVVEHWIECMLIELDGDASDRSADSSCGRRTP